MKNKKNRFFSTNFILLSAVCMSYILLMTACSRSDSADTVVTSQSVTTTVSNTGNITGTSVTAQTTGVNVPSVSPLPDAVTDNPDIDESQKLISLVIDTSKYDVKLLSDSQIINSDDYYVFLVSYHGETIEPLILVNKETKELSCISSDNVITDISEHPLYMTSDSNDVKWEGTYCMTDDNGNTVAGIAISNQSDSQNTFNFTAYKYTGENYSNLSGTASLSDNVAVFAGENDVSMTFTLTDESIVISNATDEESKAFEGTYTLTDDVTVTGKITSGQALNILYSLSADETGLPGASDNYYYYVSDENTIVKNHLCFIINVFTLKEHELSIFDSFYVTTDGLRVYHKEDSTYSLIYSSQ